MLHKLSTLVLSLLITTILLPGQSIEVYDIEAKSFPRIKASFFAFDKDGKPLRPSSSDIKIFENGTGRMVTNVYCPPATKPKAISATLVMDVSGSMSGPNIEMTKRAAAAWVNGLPLGESECALTTFDHSNYLIKSFTKDRATLLNGIAQLSANGGTDFDVALIDPVASGLQISKRGKYKKVIIMLTDGQAAPPRIEEIIAEAGRQGCTIYTVVLGMPAPDALQEISKRTGGTTFDNITTVKQAESIYRRILQQATGIAPCEIEWQSDFACSSADVSVKVTLNNVVSEDVYTPNEVSVIRLEADPQMVFFGPVAPNSVARRKVTLKAVNHDFTITNSMLYGSKAYTIEGVTFPLTIPRNGSKELTIVYAPTDSNQHYAFVRPETGTCTSGFSAFGGFPQGELVGQTLKLTSHNCGSYSTAGIDTLITWDGIPETDVVMIEYSSDGGDTWDIVTDNATGGRYLWTYPPLPASTKCLLRVTQMASDDIDYQQWTSTFEPYALSKTVNSDFSRIAYIKPDRTVSIRDARTGDLINTIRSQGTSTPIIAWTSDNHSLAITTDKGIEIVDALSGRKERLYPTASQPYLISLNQTRSKLAYVSNDGELVVLDVKSGREIQRKSNLTFTVTQLLWDNDGSFTLVGECTQEVEVEDEYNLPLQSDESDCMWTMRAPSIKWQNPVISIGKTVVGSQKDTVVRNSLCNNGTVPVHILGATIASGDIEQFVATNGLRDVVLQPGECFSHEFSFKPTAEGEYTAYVTVSTTIGDFEDKFELRGQGVPQSIRVLTEYVDFGQVELKKKRDTIVVAIANTGDQVVTFDSIAYVGPTPRVFSNLVKSRRFDLKPGETISLQLRFAPQELDLANGQFYAYHRSVGSPAMIQVIGEGIPTVLPEELRSVSFIDTVKIDKRGIANPYVVDGKEERLNTRRTFTDKIVVTDSLRRTDTLFVPFIVITGDITAVGVDRNGNEQATAKLTIDMNTSNRVVSILPYIFFDEASATLPNRYKRISASDVATYDIDRLFFDSTLAIYHSILNVIGKRLILYPKATLTITGHNANTGSELGDTALSRQRARVIKSYLRDVWGVSANRLIIKAKNLPSAKSLPITEAVTAEENRRVELSSNDERILSPVSLNNTVTTSDPPSLRFKLSGAADLGLNTYKVEAGQQSNMENAFVSSGAFTGSKVVDWQVEADQRTAPRFDEPLHMSLTLSDKSGNEKLVDTDSMKLDVITVQRKMKENLDGFEVDRFNMILFDFNETEVSDLNKGIISKIQRRVKPGSITEIVGSTDSIGASAYNMRLSNERAQAVKMLIKRKGVTANGVGEEQLLFDNALPEGRFYCRTVSVTVKTPLK